MLIIPAASVAFGDASRRNHHNVRPSQSQYHTVNNRQYSGAEQQKKLPE